MIAARPTTGPGRRARRLGLLACALVAVLGSSLVWQSAYAAFTASSGPVAATLSTGTVVLGDDDAGATLFTPTNIRPGATGERCIRVTSTGTGKATVRMYGTGRSTTNGLSSALTLRVRMGTGGSAASCADFTPAATVYDGSLAGFTADGFASGLGSWTTTGLAPESRTYQLTWTLPTSAPLSAQNGRAAVTVVWEAQSR